MYMMILCQTGSCVGLENLIRMVCVETLRTESETREGKFVEAWMATDENGIDPIGRTPHR